MKYAAIFNDAVANLKATSAVIFTNGHRHVLRANQPFKVGDGTNHFFVWKADRVYNALRLGDHILVEKSGELRCIRIEQRYDWNNTIVKASKT